MSTRDDVDDFLEEFAEQTHPCDECGRPTPESELRQVEPTDDEDSDEDWLCKGCYAEATEGEEWKNDPDEEEEL